MKTKILFVCILVTISSLAFAEKYLDRETLESIRYHYKDDQVSLINLLVWYAVKHDLYLTTEFVDDTTGFGKHLFYNQPVSRNLTKENELSKFMRGIEAEIQYKFDWSKSKAHPNIIHIIDRRLINCSNYVLDKSMEAFSFKGTPASLIENLHKSFNLLRPLTYKGVFSGASTPGTVDSFTRIELDIKTKTTIRNILIDGIPLDGYSRIIWAAKTNLETMQTRVSYKGIVPTPLPSDGNQDIDSILF